MRYDFVKNIGIKKRSNREEYDEDKLNEKIACLQKEKDNLSQELNKDSEELNKDIEELNKDIEELKNKIETIYN